MYTTNDLVKLWMLPSCIQCDHYKSCEQLIQSLTKAYTNRHEYYKLFIYNGNWVDISLLRFFLMSKIGTSNTISSIPHWIRIGFLCIEIKGLERPYQMYLCSEDQDNIQIVVRGATTDQLIAYGKMTIREKKITFKFTGSSNWHYSLASLLKTKDHNLQDTVKKAIISTVLYKNHFNICIDAYTNIGHALQNEIGPLLLTNAKINLRNHILARKPGPYNIYEYFNENKIIPQNSDNIISIFNQIHIYQNCLIPAGSNPRLGIYASYKIGGPRNTRIGNKARKLRQHLASYDEVIYVSPRIDHKRGVCINQELLIEELINRLELYCKGREQKIIFVMEKLWFTTNTHTKVHNAFISKIICGQKNKNKSVKFKSLPKLELQEKLYVLRATSVFVGAGGANFCTFLDWQGNEVPGIIYGDYDLMIKGKYFEEFLHSMYTGKKINGRYVLFGENLKRNTNGADYKLSEQQIYSSIRGLIKFLSRKHGTITA